MSDILFNWYSESDSIVDFEQGLNLAKNSGATSLLILACDENNYTLSTVDFLLSSCDLPIFGGIYPQLIYKQQLMQKGCIIIGFEQSVDISLITQLSELSSDELLEQAIEKTTLKKNQLSDNGSFLMFYDFSINNIENFIDCLFECLDYQINIMGGGAGNLAFEQKPCIFTNQGLLVDCIQIVNFRSKLTIASTHGWNMLQGPFLVSEAQNHTIKSLDYQPAFTLYKEAIEKVSDHKFTDDNFFDIAKNFPFGIESINSQLIVRDPILTQDGHVQCVGNIPVNSLVYLLQGSKDSLVDSAEQAILLVNQKAEKENKELSATMVFDCISRVLYLEDDFTREINSIAKHCEGQALFGVLSLGEIANSKTGSIRLLNKSTVIGSW